MALTAVPNSASFPSTGGVSEHKLNNGGSAKLVFKVRSSNNTDYRVTPVHGFVQPNAFTMLRIMRSGGPQKNDKVVVQFGPAGAQTDAKSAFAAIAQTAHSITIPLSVLAKGPPSMTNAVPAPAASSTTDDELEKLKKEVAMRAIEEALMAAAEEEEEEREKGSISEVVKALAPEPTSATCTAAGATFDQKLKNLTPEKLVFKVKCSDNNLYRVMPVYGFVEPNGSTSIKVTRIAGPAKKDKLVILFANAAGEKSDAIATFCAVAMTAQSVTINIVAN